MLFTVLWVLWLLAFLVIEGAALVRKERGDTLSEHVWSVLKRRALFWWLGAGFLGWLVVHFLVGGFGGWF